MFSGFKFNAAIASVLSRARANGLVSGPEVSAMSDIAMKGANHQYGKAMLAQRAAASPTAAVAAVFARLAVAAEASPGPVSSGAWEVCAVTALELSGATTREAEKVVADLKKMERAAGWGSPGNE